jgi:hypothetical protein
LKASGYASLVIFVDQAEKLVGNQMLTDEFMNIYSPDWSAGLNVYFVFVGTNDVSQLKSTEEHGGFARRFLDPAQASSTDAELASPIINGGADDDIHRIKSVLGNLKQQYPGLTIPSLGDQRMKKIRRELQSLATGRGGSLTWPMLWRKILSE